MAHVNIPISFWGDALLTIAYILHRVSSKRYPSLHMSYGMVESPPWNIYADKVWLVMYIM